jgi:hypothetical protein
MNLRLFTRKTGDGTMLRMGELTENYNLPKRSVLPVRDRYEDGLRAAKKTRLIKFNGQNITGEAFVNAAVMHFLDMPEGKRLAILQEYVPKFEALFNGADTDSVWTVPNEPETPSEGLQPSTRNVIAQDHEYRPTKKSSFVVGQTTPEERAAIEAKAAPAKAKSAKPKTHKKGSP